MLRGTRYPLENIIKSVDVFNRKLFNMNEVIQKHNKEIDKELLNKFIKSLNKNQIKEFVKIVKSIKYDDCSVLNILLEVLRVQNKGVDINE